MIKTYSAKESEIKREWHVIDASDKILGKVAVEAATLLIGKHKPMFTRNQDTGDYVVIINADKVKVTGSKETKKLYYSHSGYPSGFKKVSLGKVMEINSTLVIERAIKGMLPHTRLGSAMFKKLKIYAGNTHPHEAQVGPAAKS
jgi:large subunit ribosomal protein L13